MSKHVNTNMAIFENYEEFITDNRDTFNTPTGAIRMLSDKSMFNQFSDKLTEAMDDDVRDTVLGVLKRQKEAVLEEAANVPASGFTHGLKTIQ